MIRKQRSTLTTQEMKNQKSTLMLVTICMFHLVSFILYYVVWVNQNKIVYFVYIINAYSGPAMDVVIYLIFGKRIRQAFARLCQCH